MEENVFTFDEQADTTTLCLRNGAYTGKRFSVDVHFCENPFCMCQTAYLRCLPLEDGVGASPIPLEFELDMAEKQIQRRSEQPPSPEALRLGEDMLTEMNEADWNLLQIMLLEYKGRKTEEADITMLDAPFPEQALRDPTTLVYAVDVLPWIRPFLFYIGTESWLMIDAYCCNPDCDCEEAIVFFHRLGDRQADGAINVAQITAGAAVNTRTGAVKPMHPPWKEEISLQTFFQAVSKAEPDVIKQLDKRHRNLRLLYKKAHNKFRKTPSFRDNQPFDAGEAIASARSTKLKPNEPCSCGSGKKYKKCCGRLV